MGLGTTGHISDHIQMIRDANRSQFSRCLVRSHGDERFAHSRHLARFTQPTHDCFIPDTQPQHVIAAQIGILAPVQGGLLIQKITVFCHFDCQDLTQITFPNQALYGFVDAQGERGGHNLSYQVRSRLRRRQHLLRFLQIAGHARLAHDMLTCLEGANCRPAMQVGPGADDDRIDIGSVNELPPVIIDNGNIEFRRDLHGGGSAPVTDGDDFHTLDGA